MNIDLRGKNALVCGSTKGIGFAIAKQFALMGANVTMMARNGALLERVVRDLHAEEGQKHDFLVADFSKPEQVKAAIEEKIQQGVVNGMKQSGYGRIINIISTSVKIPLKGLGVSNTIRGAVASWSKTLATELAPMGITVNNILPGATGTDRLKQIIEGKAVKQNESIEEVNHEMLSEIPMNRFAQPEEIAYAACFLASPYAAYITGINVPVDGGRTGCL